MSRIPDGAAFRMSVTDASGMRWNTVSFDPFVTGRSAVGYATETRGVANPLSGVPIVNQTPLGAGSITLGEKRAWFNAASGTHNGPLFDAVSGLDAITSKHGITELSVVRGHPESTFVRIGAGEGVGWSSELSTVISSSERTALGRLAEQAADLLRPLIRR